MPGINTPFSPSSASHARAPTATVTEQMPSLKGLISTVSGKTSENSDFQSLMNKLAKQKSSAESLQGTTDSSPKTSEITASSSRSKETADSPPNQQIKLERQETIDDPIVNSPQADKSSTTDSNDMSDDIGYTNDVSKAFDTKENDDASSVIDYTGNTNNIYNPSPALIEETAVALSTKEKKTNILAKESTPIQEDQGPEQPTSFGTEILNDSLLLGLPRSSSAELRSHSRLEHIADSKDPSSSLLSPSGLLTATSSEADPTTETTSQNASTTNLKNPATTTSASVAEPSSVYQLPLPAGSVTKPVVQTATTSIGNAIAADHAVISSAASTKANESEAIVLQHHSSLLEPPSTISQSNFSDSNAAILLLQQEANKTVQNDHIQSFLFDTSEFRTTLANGSKNAAASSHKLSTNSSVISNNEVSFNVSSLVKNFSISATEAGAPSAPPRPVPVIEQIAFTLFKAANEGEGSYTVRLNPPNLGQIDIELKIDKSNVVNAVLKADSPATIMLMKQDQHILERSLNDAGLNLDNKSLNFGLRQQASENDGNQEQQDSKTYHNNGIKNAISDNETQPVRYITNGLLDICV